MNHTEPEESDQNCNVNVSTDYGNQHFAEPNDGASEGEEFEGDVITLLEMIIFLIITAMYPLFSVLIIY